MKRRGAAALCVLALLGAAPAAASEWQLVLRQDGIEVHRREVPGSRLLEFRGRGVIAAPLPRLLGVLRDVEHRTEWTERCIEAQIIEQRGERGQVSYNRTDAPWPVADRDVVLLGETRVDVAERRVRLEFRSVEDPRMPPRTGVVRMPMLRGHWHFTPIGGGAATEAEYQVHADPGGALPTWIANLAARQIPLKTLLGMRRQSQRRSYPAFEAWIREQPEFGRIAMDAHQAP